MASEICKDITSWVDPIKEQVEECIERDCNWFCLCCNKWLCSMVWVVIVAGKWVTEKSCELISTVAKVMVEFVAAVAEEVVKVVKAVGGWILNRLLDPEALNKA